MSDARILSDDADEPPGISWRVKLAIGLMVILAIGVVLVTNRWLSERFTETTRNRAELRLALYSGNMVSELQRTSVVPLLLAGDPALVEALRVRDFSGTSQKLIRVQSEIGVASILLIDADGRTVGATNRNLLGTNHRTGAYFVEAMRNNDTIFTAQAREGGGFDFTYSRSVLVDGKSGGVIVVAVDLMKYERAWAGLQDAVMVTDSEGTVILATEPRWRGLSMDEALAVRDGEYALGASTITGRLSHCPNVSATVCSPRW